MESLLNSAGMYFLSYFEVQHMVEVIFFVLIQVFHCNLRNGNINSSQSYIDPISSGYPVKNECK